jgi:hypothetical protein
MGASLFLIIWYSFITGSQFIDGYMEDIYENINLSEFQKNIYNGMSSVCQRVNSIFGRDIMYPPDVNIKEEPVEVIYESNSQDTESDSHSDSEVEDVTEQFKAEQEANKEVIDLTEEADDKNEEHKEKEEHIALESSDTAPMGTTEQNKEEDYTVIPDAIEEE